MIIRDAFEYQIKGIYESIDLTDSVISTNAELCDIQEFLKIFNKSIDGFSSAHKNIAKNFYYDEEEMWQLTPNHIKEKWMTSLANEYKSIISDDLNKKYFHDTFINIRRFLRKLRPSKIDIEKLNKINEYYKTPAYRKINTLVANNKTGSGVKLKYTNSNTVTGRVTIVDGPNILSFPSKFKYALKSRFKNGSIIQIDLISAEPSIALRLNGVNDVVDPYEYVASIMPDKKLDRDLAKSIVLCTLYGQSPNKISEKLPKNIDVNDIIEKTKELFFYDNIRDDIVRKIDPNDAIPVNYRNYFERPIYLSDNSDRTKVNYYLQSTAAEAAIIAFDGLYNTIKDYCVPLFLIHDALIIDCNKELSDYLKNKDVLKLKANNLSLYSKIKCYDDINEIFTT
jgi:hypothetical protein